MTGSTRLKRTLALALAGGSLAIGVPAALAAGGGASPPASTTIQDGQQQRPDREDCPEKDGERGSSAEPGGANEAPAI